MRPGGYQRFRFRRKPGDTTQVVTLRYEPMPGGAGQGQQVQVGANGIGNAVLLPGAWADLVVDVGTNRAAAGTNFQALGTGPLIECVPNPAFGPNTPGVPMYKLLPE